LFEALTLTWEYAMPDDSPAGASAEPCVDQTCPVARAVAVLEGKWTMLVIRDLLEGTRRFSELRESLAGISPKTLTDRLRDLEAYGLVNRVMYAEIPPRVEYSLTEAGRALRPVVQALAAWGGTQLAVRGGTPLVASGGAQPVQPSPTR
jgi:DNA-binding HxlR family transcriptional regulator